LLLILQRRMDSLDTREQWPTFGVRQLASSLPLSMPGQIPSGQLAVCVSVLESWKLTIVPLNLGASKLARTPRPAMSTRKIKDIVASSQ
jgi:hypothetical protein